jgi:hypothetical protein
VQRAELLDRGRHDRGPATFVADVLDESKRAAGLPCVQFRREFLDTRRVDVGDHDPRAFAHESLGVRPARPLAAPVTIATLPLTRPIWMPPVVDLAARPQTPRRTATQRDGIKQP